MTATSTTAALSGLRVLEFSRVLAGPWCGMQLADLGADVIKIEPPEGDDTRGYGPPFRDGLSAYFACCNRGKRSIALDLHHPQARPLLARMIERADVLIQNFRPGAAEGLGLGAADALARNPRLVYCAISGYGSSGPGAGRAGYDFVVQAESGLMAITGPMGGPASKVGVAVADLFAGLDASTAILAALLARERSGRGQAIEISLFDAQLQALANVASSVLFTGEDAVRHGNAHASIVPYQTFAAADGEFALACASDRLWQRLCSLLERPEWTSDPRCASNRARVEHRQWLIPNLAACFAGHRVADWLQRLQAAGIPAAPVNGVRAALAGELVAARGLHVDADGIPMIASPLRLSGTPVVAPRRPPHLGEHADAVCNEHGMDASALRECGALAY
jgi:crotonobetainyl-CoA:carnitine CoA-transferase CaiB-like acyl-CoA transferase